MGAAGFGPMLVFGADRYMHKISEMTIDGGTFT